MTKEIKHHLMRYFAKVRINLRKNSLKSIPPEQIELYNFTKNLVRQNESKVLYCPYSGNILIKNEDRGREVLIKGDEVTIIKEGGLVNSLIDPMLKDAIISYISRILEAKIQVTEERYRNCIKEFNRNS